MNKIANAWAIYKYGIKEEQITSSAFHFASSGSLYSYVTFFIGYKDKKGKEKRFDDQLEMDDFFNFIGEKLLQIK